MAITLTPEQAQAKAYLVAFIEENSTAPTYREMADDMGLSSTSMAHSMVVALEERGHVRRLKRRSRALEVLEVK